jgi:hypothetical protein
MMNRFFVIIAIGLIMIACAEKKDQNVNNKGPLEEERYSNPVDSVISAHFAFLDSFANNKPFENSVVLDRIIESLIFIEKITGIPAKVDSGPVGPYNVREEDIIRWKKWYDENKFHLKWDEETKSIFRAKDWDERATYVNVVDSIFSAHFALLDSMDNVKFSERSYVQKYKIGQSLIFMERMTGIPAGSGFDRFAPRNMPKETITEWRKWYRENKSLLMWNPTLKIIVRVQK